MFEDFTVSLGPLPTNTDRLVFKAIQTYSNGDVVRWIDTPTPGGAGPGPSGADRDAAQRRSVLRTASTDLAGPTVTVRRDSSLPLGCIGVLVGLVACVLAAFALRRNRRPAP